MGKYVVLALMLVVAMSELGLAGWNGDMRVAVHVVDHSAKRGCGSGLPAIQTCDDIATTFEGQDADCFPVFYNLVEYKGCEYGLTWPGTYTGLFTSCSDLILGDIVNPGDGVSQTWSDCMYGNVMIPGWVWIYEPGQATVCVVEHPESHRVSALDCSEGLDSPIFDPFCAGIGGAEGDDPCYGYISNDGSTWGSVKSLFR